MLRKQIITVTKETIEEFKKYLDEEKVRDFEERMNCTPMASDFEYDRYVSLIEKNINQMGTDIWNIENTIKAMEEDGCKGKITIKHCYTMNPSSYYTVSFEKTSKKNGCTCKYVPSHIEMQAIGGCISDYVLLRLCIYRGIFQTILKHMEEKLQQQHKNVTFEYGDLYQYFIKVIAEDLSKCESGLFDVMNYEKFCNEYSKDFKEIDVVEYNGSSEIYNHYLNVLEPCMSEVYHIKHDMQDRNLFDCEVGVLTPGPRGLITVLSELSYMMRHSNDPVGIDFGPIIEFIKNYKA